MSPQARPRSGQFLAAATLLFGCTTGTPIHAAEGGTVRSPDGQLMLILPPDALPSDTEISIEALTPDQWPVQAPSRFDRIGEVYGISPAGIELRREAYLVVFPPADRVLRDEDGDLMAVHYTWGPSDEKVRPAALSRTVMLKDGRVAIVGSIFELGTHWVGDRVPGVGTSLPLLRLQVSTSSAARAVGESWSLDDLALTSDQSHTLFGQSALATVVAPTESPGIEPVPWGSRALSRWDATFDADLGAHPYAVFDLGPEPRIETYAALNDPTPVELDELVTLRPLHTPLPSWSCARPAGDDEHMLLTVDVITGASEGVVRVGRTYELDTPACR